MGLKEILEDIDKKTGSEVEGILQKSDAEAKRIREEAEGMAKEKEQQASVRSEKEAEQIMLRETSKANIAAKMAYDLAANKKIESAIGKIPSKLSEYSKGAKYKKLLNALAAKAVQELGSNCTILVRKEDEQFLNQGTGFSVGTVKGIISGGVIAVSEDKRREVDYTLEALLGKLHDKIAQKLQEQVRRGVD